MTRRVDYYLGTAENNKSYTIHARSNSRVYFYNMDSNINGIFGEQFLQISVTIWESRNWTF